MNKVVLHFDELNQPVVPLDVIEDDKSSAPKERGSFGDNYDK